LDKSRASRLLELTVTDRSVVCHHKQVQMARQFAKMALGLLICLLPNARHIHHLR
jgi:hypothetical protein